MGIGEVLDASLRLYRHAWLPILGLSALFVAPYTAATLFLNTAAAGDLLSASLLRAAGRPAAVPSPEALAGMNILAVAGGVILGPLVYCAVVRVADQAWRGEAPSVGAAVVWSLRRLFALLVTSLLALLAGLIFNVIAFLLIVMVTSFGALAIGTTGMKGTFFTVGAGIWAVLSTLTGVALGSACWLSFLFIPQVVAAESRGYFGAIGRSMSLAWSHIFRVTGLFWSTLLLSGSLLLTVLLPRLLWSTAVGESGADLVGKIALGVIALLVLPLLPVVTTVAYHDLWLRTEGPDLEERLRRLEGEAGHA
jgi:hypothetical protein